MKDRLEREILNQVAPRVKFEKVTVTSLDGIKLAGIWTKALIIRLVKGRKLKLVQGKDSLYLQNPKQPNLPGFE